MSNYYMITLCKFNDMFTFFKFSFAVSSILCKFAVGIVEMLLPLENKKGKHDLTSTHYYICIPTA